MKVYAAMLLGGLLSLLASGTTLAQQSKVFCVFDPGGANGPIYRMMEDYRSKAISSGIRLDMRPYPDEDKLVEDYVAGTCDLAGVTDMGARKFNRFTGSISAIGALPYYEDLRVLMYILASGRVDEYLEEGDHVFMGAAPMGAAYLFVNDKSINHVDALRGKRFAVLEGHLDAEYTIEYLGGIAVEAKISNFHTMFNRGEVDVAYGPAAAYEVLEMYKGMNNGGGLVKYPVGQITIQLFARKGEFDERFVDRSRKNMSRLYPQAMRYVRQYERDIPEERWVEISGEAVRGYQEMLRNVRIEMQNSETEEGQLAARAYHPEMMRVLRKIRCYTNPGSIECMTGGVE
ncbi:putative solute-binding protein [Marinobacter sp.]|uniref:putative solute-binding protein n=1 Tax=Marinobacter sp. TaxID=50741 RepID=UPI0019889338|nr:putative solute-binding protein [Marinobacter sp.]MBC7192086.1 hypothetical protein [Marinobacter sp.]